MNKLSCTVEEEGKTYILKMEGAITAQTLPEYREMVSKVMGELGTDNKDNLNFIVDYAKISDIDSSALANILDRLENDVRRDHKVVFINIPEKLKSIVELHSMERRVQVYDSEEEAKKALGND